MFSARRPLPLSWLAAFALFLVTSVSLWGQIATTTGLVVIPASPVSVGTVLTLTATVTDFNNAAVTVGTVNFCDDSINTHCTGLAVVGTAQLTSAGVAGIKLRLGIGPHSLGAVFEGTNTDATSSSSVQPVTVTGKYASATSISATPGASTSTYDLTATVVGLAPQSVTPSPTGSVQFVDTSDASTVLASGSLVAAAYNLNFTASETLAVGQDDDTVVVGDFNGDGVPDLAVSNSYQTDTVSVMLGNGDGTFQPQVSYPTGNGPFGLTIGDFNGDEKPDLVTANFDDNTVSVLLGNGNGIFQPQATYAIPAGGAYAVAVGDFNGDGKLDLVVTSQTGNTVSVLLGNGDGTFRLPRPTQPVTRPTSSRWGTSTATADLIWRSPTSPIIRSPSYLATAIS